MTSKLLPRIKVEDLPLYDYENDILAGYLFKKASNKSKFSKGKWLKRFFVINHNLDDYKDENYSLAYYHSPLDKQPRQTFDLYHAVIIPSGGLTFRIDFKNSINLELSTESYEFLQFWIETLEKVIGVANKRGDLLHVSLPTDSIEPLYEEPYFADENLNKHVNDHSEVYNENSYLPDANKISTNRKLPCLRLFFNINNIPPGSHNRKKFVELFTSELAKSLELNHSTVEVVSIKKHPTLHEMTLIEFDFNLYEDPENYIPDEEYNEERAHEQDEELEYQRFQILKRLCRMVQEHDSGLFSGKLTCKIDPSFYNTIIIYDQNGVDDALELFSSDPRVLQILQKYADTKIDSNYISITYFTIYIKFENMIRPFSVPNPVALPRRDCAIYPFEVKRVFGFSNTFQELWIEPIALIPINMPKALSQPILFEESARLGRAFCIHSSRLKANQIYELQCEDYRSEMLESLTDDEIENIQQLFDEYDSNGEGYISRYDLEDLVRQRTLERNQIILQKYEDLCKSSRLSLQARISAESTMNEHLQHLEDTKSKAIKMFEASDINGDGLISFTEFMLFEAWWLRCTLNPERSHLF